MVAGPYNKRKEWKPAEEEGIPASELGLLSGGVRYSHKWLLFVNFSCTAAAAALPWPVSVRPASGVHLFAGGRRVYLTLAGRSNQCKAEGSEGFSTASAAAAAHSQQPIQISPAEWSAELVYANCFALQVQLCAGPAKPAAADQLYTSLLFVVRERE